jgi:hypothetical protein
MAGRIKVVFASLLKPVDEPRMYDKLGRSLAQTYKYDVNIIGFKSKNLCNDPLIRCWPLFDFPRISLARTLAPLQFFKKLVQLKPQLLVLTSPDFLLVSSLYKIIFGCHILYDLQENAYRNIIWSHNKPSLLRRMRAAAIRAKEYICDRIIIRYIAAERSYLIECSFISKPVLVLENKARKPEAAVGQLPRNGASDPLRLLYTGTIAESYGVLDTFTVADAIQALHATVDYTICGHCPSPLLLQKLQELARTRPWVKLLASPTPIPHQQILEQLHRADFTFVAYRLNPANQGSMPTRVWEALAWKTPMILREEHPWLPLIRQYKAGFSIDYNSPDTTILKEAIGRTDYFTQELPQTIYWESIEASWIALVDELFSKSQP